jgi:hypothetical protein
MTNPRAGLRASVGDIPSVASQLIFLTESNRRCMGISVGNAIPEMEKVPKGLGQTDPVYWLVLALTLARSRGQDGE